MAVDSGVKVGMVFGELVHGEVDVRIWIHPDHRKRVTEPRHCASRARRWPGRSRPCRWSPARPRPNPPSREVPAGSIRFGLAGGRQADRRRIRGANAAAGSQLA